MRPALRAIALVSTMALGACDVNVNGGAKGEEAKAGAATAAPKQTPEEIARARLREEARRPLQNLQFVVDVSDRKLRLMQGGQTVAEHPVAVGTAKWPTPTGSWKLHRVDINPEWNPPKDESWAEEREPKGPGDPKNPMGRARLVYRMPNTIHGTEDIASLGKAASHGSIRVANPVVLQLAETLLKAGGAWDGPEKFKQMAENRARQFQVTLPNPVPITVQE